MRIHSSVRQWVLSFVAVDALFFLLLVGNCLWRPVDCLEAFTFGPFMFYLPAVMLLDALPVLFQPLASMPFWAMITLMFVLGALSHALVGAAIGWLLRARTVRPFVSFAAALAVLFLTTAGIVWMQQREEVARETYSNLWAVENVSGSMISYRDATVTGLESPSTFELRIDEGTTTLTLDNTDRTKVWLICNVESCTDEAVDGKVQMTFGEYVAVHNACEQDPTTCPYYGIGILDLFEVVHDPRGIVTMVQYYTP